MAEPDVLLALTPHVERAVEHLLFSDGAGLTLAASAADAAELERLADDSVAEAVLLSPDLPGLSTGLCARLRAGGLRLVGVALDEPSAAALRAHGVDAIVDGTAGRERLLEALLGEPDSAPEVPVARERVIDSRQEVGGSVLAVVGTRGAPGASECAASLAALARWPAALVECDVLGGGLDVRLAADAHDGSLLGLVRACVAGDGAVGELLDRWFVRRPGWPPVLLAPPDTKEKLGELARPGATAGALRALAAAAPLVVCDVGFLLDEGGDVGAVARCHREALACADAVLLVIGARERQLRDGLAQLDLLRVELEIDDRRLRVALNAVGAPGTGKPETVIEPLAEALAARGLALDACLPYDARALRRAERHGMPLAAVRPRGPYARAVRSLLKILFLPAQKATPRERKLLLRRPPLIPRDAEEVLPWRTS